MHIPTVSFIRQLPYVPDLTKASPIAKHVPMTSDNESSVKLESLRDKLKSGKKLTDREMNFLRRHDPQLYGKALMLGIERASYESAVRRFRTKGEVLNFHNQTLMSIMKADHDPEHSLMRINAVQDSHRQYVRSHEYASLAWK